jgi:hypothetical protein
MAVHHSNQWLRRIAHLLVVNSLQLSQAALQAMFM